MAQAAVISHDEAPRLYRLALLASLLLMMLVSLRLTSGAWLFLSDQGGSTQQGAHLNKGEYQGSYLSDVGTLQKQGKRVMLAEKPEKVQNVLQGKAKAWRGEMQKDQPGSRPPQCHNECPRCQGGACVARPSFSRVVSSGSSSQHAVWTCACLHA
ncbi:hypothetical protein GOP47_0011047 [Adiantum capillus-veneris]|uniref:Uncharacterized protein n=1 Tax=Adiantum capillus-veneris TaxID=13818 RepID=A0A9D4USG2_ADICA|nr:hypothetical protein GOP47_0011047 [Adiantum capillus-veneris]